jgi:hypothetical protein
VKSDTILDLRKDTEALKQLDDLEELVDVPPERGGVYFSNWEREFIKSVRQQHDETLDFSPKQHDKIKDIWHAVDLRKRAAPDEKAANLFSNLSPERQAEMRERAGKIRLPWEK